MTGLPAPDGELTHLFPTPAAIAELGPAAIAGPAAPGQAICDAAAAMADGSLIVDTTRSTAELTADLVARPGIGPWTAGYVAMRLLADPDVLLPATWCCAAVPSCSACPRDPSTSPGRR